MKTLNLLLADSAKALQAFATTIALISATIVTAAVATLIVYTIGGTTSTGIDLFLRLMNMDTNLYYMYSSQFLFKNEIFQIIALFNWLVLVGGIGGMLVLSLLQYIDNLQYRAAISTTARTAVKLHAYTSDRNEDDFKQAGNS